MKLRCTHNSIRIRIRKSELNELQEKGEIMESITFVPYEKQLTFGLSISNGVKNSSLSAAFIDSREIMVFINKTEAEKCFATGINDYLAKPYNPEDLKGKIMTLVYKKKHREAVESA